MARTLYLLQTSPTRQWPGTVLITATTIAPEATQPEVENRTVVKAGEGVEAYTELELMTG